MMNIDLSYPWDDQTTEEQYISRMLIKRNELLSASDWAMFPDSPTDKQAWSTYRQLLREFSSTWQPGPTADFPDPPSSEPVAYKQPTDAEVMFSMEVI